MQLSILSLRFGCILRSTKWFLIRRQTANNSYYSKHFVSCSVAVGIMFLLCQDWIFDFSSYLPKNENIFLHILRKLSTVFEKAYKSQLHCRTHTMSCISVRVCVYVCVRFCVFCSLWLQVKFPAHPLTTHYSSSNCYGCIWKYSTWIQLDVAAPSRTHTHTHLLAYMHHQCGCFNKAFSCRRTTKITRCKAQSTGPPGDYNNGRCSCAPLCYTASKKYAGTVSSKQCKVHAKTNECWRDTKVEKDQT